MKVYWVLNVALFCAFGTKLSSTERAHKVHNIVLYPEKYSWCSRTPIQQIVASPGYEPVTIDNNVCVGACYSYSIPKTQPAEPGELIGPYCDSCQPAKIKCYHVNLKADDQNTDGPRTMQKRVQIIVDCACLTCDKVRKDNCDISDEDTLELPSNLFLNTNSTNKTQPQKVPELLKMQSHVYDGNKPHHPNKKKLLELLVGRNDSSDESDNDIFEDILKMHDDDEDVIRLPDDSLKRNHYNVVPEPETTQTPIESTSQQQHHHHHHHHHHHLGDVQLVGETVEHHVKGPHGSMILAPVEKLHIDSDALKANDEGLVISYENHDTKKTNHDIIVN